MLHGALTGSRGHFGITYTPHLTSWWWLVTALGWLMPLIIAVLVGSRQRIPANAGNR